MNSGPLSIRRLEHLARHLLLLTKAWVGQIGPHKEYDRSTATVIGSVLVSAAVRGRLFHRVVLSLLHWRMACPVKTVFQRHRGFGPALSLCFHVAGSRIVPGELLRLPVRPMQHGRHRAEHFFAVASLSPEAVHSVERRRRLQKAAVFVFQLHGGLSHRAAAENFIPRKSWPGNLPSLATGGPTRQPLIPMPGFGMPFQRIPSRLNLTRQSSVLPPVCVVASCRPAV